MRISRITITDIAPVKKFEIEASSSVVIIAGANGSGKTRIKQAIVASFQNPMGPQAGLTVEATRQEEEAAWGAKSLTVGPQAGSAPLNAYMNGRTKGNTYVGTVVQVDSNRSIQQIKYQTWGLATEDPDDQENPLGYYLSYFGDRWTQFMNRLHQKAASRDQKIAADVKGGPPERTVQQILASFPDPFDGYQAIFAQLLPGKNLNPIDPKSPRDLTFRTATASSLPFTSLSSGEQEVVKVAFELASRKISHSVVLLDEPELHLHPTLAFRLLETLKGLAQGTNQFILFTHSADLISTYYSTGNVFFIDTTDKTGNQARQLSAIGQGHIATARAVGANLGLFAIGKKIIFIEGQEASADRVVYHRVAQVAFPDAYLLPIGGVENLMALRSIAAELERTVFGIELFMIRDRDGLTDNTIRELEASSRLRCLTRRHVENYLLNDDLLAEVAKQLYLAPELRQADTVGRHLLDAARATLPVAVVVRLKDWTRMYGALPGPVVRDAHKLALDDLVAAAQDSVRGSAQALAASFDGAKVEAFVRAEHARLEGALVDGSWRSVFPGKMVFSRFCGDSLRADPARVREAAADLAVSKRPQAFDDLFAIMRHFSGVTSPAEGG